MYFVDMHLCDFFQDLTMKLSLIQSVGLIARAVSECVKRQGYIFARKQELINVMLVSSPSFKLVKASHDYLGVHETKMDFSSLSLLICQDFMKAEPADSLRTPVRHLVMTTCANLMYPSTGPKRIYNFTD